MTVVSVPNTPPVRVPAPHATNPAADQWTEIGPAVTVRGGAMRGIRLSGAFRALAVHRNGDRAYAGSVLGGLWYTGDGGASWIPLDFYASVRDRSGGLRPADALTVGAIAVRWGAGPDTDFVCVGPGTRPATGAWAREPTVQGVGIRVATGAADVAARQGAAATADRWTLEATDLAGVSVAALALDAAGDRVWAATSRGLYRRPAGGGDAWDEVDAALGNAAVSGVVVLVPGLAAEPQRIYVAAEGGRLARSVDGQAWQAVPLPTDPANPLPATPVGAVRLVPGNVPGRAVVWAVADGPRLWRIDGDVAEVVTNLPREVFRARTFRSPGTTVEGLPELALAVHPETDAAHQDLIALAGAAPFNPGPAAPEPAIFVGRVTRVGGAWTFPLTFPAAPAGAPPDQWVGAGLPSGVRSLAWTWGAGTPQSHLWIAGDRGLFRSVRDGARGSFIERNSGLGAAEPSMLAQAAGTDAVMVVGTRRGNMLSRLSAEAWEVVFPADGGGLTVDDADVRRLYAQARGGAWHHSTDGGRTWPNLSFLTSAPIAFGDTARRKWMKAHQNELAVNRATGRVATITGDDPSRGTQVTLGTDRIWYADNATRSAAQGTDRSGWVTLPTGNDPYDPALAFAPLRSRDRLTEAVVALRWGTPDRLYALTRAGVHLLERAADGSWTEQRLYDKAEARRNWSGKTPRRQIPDDLTLASLAVHDPANRRGTLYVGTAGNGDEPHLWWFDGDASWLSANLGIDTPVHALAVDPTHPEIVYAGTDAGVWRGTVTLVAGGNPSWAWTPYSNGLPEAPCVDLLLHRPDGGATPVLRAALCGRGVWEVRLDGATQGPEVYLRAHALDARRDEVVPGGARVPIRLDASPDVVVRRAAAAPPVAYTRFAAAPPRFPADADRYDVWLVKSALRAAGRDVDPLTAFEEDPRVRWSAADELVLADHLAGLAPPLPVAPTAAQVWERVVGGHPMPFDRDPDHADLLAWFRDEPDRFPKGRRPSTATSDLARVDVTVHGRHWSGIDGARISVALLRAPYEVRRIPLQNRYLGYRGMAGVAPLPPNWAAQLQVDVATMRAWRAAVPPGPVPALAALGDWAYADTTEPIRLVPATLDPSHPQVVAFEVNLAGAVWDKGWLLLAVVLADDDPIPAASRLITEVARLVPAERRVAARSVRRASRFAEEGTRLAGMDMFDYLGGRPRFDRAWARSNIVWTGLYLDSPAPQAALGDPPGPGGHVRNGGIGATPRGSWMSAWPELFGDWGLAVIYWGQQGAGAGAGPYNLVATPPNPPNAIALANAEDAAEKADVAMVQSGAVIYLDYEDAAAPNADARMYASAFFHALAERGFRPGLYGHGIVVAPMSPPAATRVFRRDVPGLFAWNVRYRPFPPPPNAWRVRGGQIILDTAQPVVLDDPDALIRQWVQENPGAVPPAPLPPLLDAAGAVVPNPVHATFRPDFNLGFLQDPAFPERSPLPREIRTGRTAVSASFQERCAIYAVRRGYPVRASWFPGIVGPLPTLGSGRVPVQWNPFSVPVALRIPPPVVAADAADVLVAFGAADAEEPTAQRIHVLRRMPNRDWEHVTLPDTGLALDPLPGVVASARSDRSIEVFAVDDDTGFLAGARFTPRRGWGTLAPLPNGAAAGDQVRRTNRPSAVSRGPGLLDLFWVATDGLLRASASSEPGRWAAPVTIGNAVQAHPLANLAAVSRAVDRLDVFFVGALAAAPPPRDWRLCVVSWTQGGGWGAATRIDLGSAAPRGPEPMAAIAACTRTAANADAFVVGMDGALHRTTLRADGTWAPLTVATAAPAVGVGIGSIDGATCQGPDDIEVVVTGRDGNVYATQWEVLASPNFIPFQRVGTLDV